MMSRIGNRRGFTLIEVMVAVAILSFGIVMLYHSFFVCADAGHYAVNLLDGRLWLDSKVAQEKELLLSTNATGSSQESGVFMFNARNYTWAKSVQLIDAGLYSLILSLSWKEAGKQRTLSYATYLAL